MPENTSVRTQAARQVIDGPFNMPLLGWRWQYFWFMRDTIRAQRSMLERYGPLCGFSRFQAGDPDATLCAFGAEYNQVVLSNSQLFYNQNVSLEAGSDTALGRLGYGLPVMNGEVHRQQRRLVQPAFHKRKIEHYVDEIIHATQAMLDTWTPGETRDISKDMMGLTMRIVVKTLFGVGYDQAASIGSMLDEWLTLVVSSSILPIKHPRLPYGKLITHSVKLEQRILELIEAKRRQVEDAPDVLTMLIHARDEDGTQMTNKELIGQINLMFAAGRDTSSNVLMWTLFLLSQHPEIAGAVIRELDENLHGNVPTMETLNSLTLLERVIKESLRILTPASFNTRVATEDFTLGPYQLPKGTSVMYSYYLTHHDPKIYAEPERFLPDRWLTINPSPYEYIPFGTGPRMCIGSAFAWVEIKLVLALMLQRFRLSLLDNTQIDRQEVITLTSKQGMPMQVMPQDGKYRRVAVTGTILDMVTMDD